MSLVVVACSLLFAGCDPDWPSAHSTSEVRGAVKLDGEPLVGAKVVFIPQQVAVDGDVSKIARGETDNLGQFSLKVDAENPTQIKHDRYRVVISKLVDGKELLHSSYNRNSLLTYEVDTQEAFDRPEFELLKTGTL